MPHVTLLTRMLCERKFSSQVFSHKSLSSILSSGLSLHLVEASPALSSTQEKTLRGVATTVIDGELLSWCAIYEFQGLILSQVMLLSIQPYLTRHAHWRVITKRKCHGTKEYRMYPEVCFTPKLNQLCVHPQW